MARKPAFVVFSARALNRATLARQMLLSRARVPTLTGVERLLALQAQLARPPFVALWARLEGFERDDLLGLLQRRAIVRAPAMRATLHLMTATDYLAFRGVIHPSLLRAAQSLAGKRAIPGDLERAEAVAREFFASRPGTFEELRSHLKRELPKRDERALAYATRLRVPLVQIPDGEKWGFAAACDFGLADAWLRRPIALDGGSAAALVRRYLAAFGPATPADAQTWSGVGRLAEVFESLRPTLVTLRDENNRELFDLPDAPRPPEDTPAPVRFLPEFDGVLLGHHDRTRVIPAQHRARFVTRNLRVPGTFLVDGLAAGLWWVDQTKRSATLVLDPFGKIASKTRQALESEGDALLRFLSDAERRGFRWHP
jgi:hypothetical protein